MRVKVLEKKLKDAGYDLVEGDTVTVSDEIGAAWCGHGWAEDVDGNVATGERKVMGDTVINPKKAVHVGRTKTKGR